jgi:hypothetical protein
MLLMFDEVDQFQHFWLCIFYHAAVSEYADISYTKLFSHNTAHEGPEEKRYSFTLTLTSALDEDVCWTPRPGCFPLGKEAWYPLYQRLGWSLGQSEPVWIVYLTWFWTLNCLTHSKLLYQLHWPSHPSLMQSHYFNLQVAFTIPFLAG